MYVGREMGQEPGARYLVGQSTLGRTSADTIHVHIVPYESRVYTYEVATTAAVHQFVSS